MSTWPPQYSKEEKRELSLYATREVLEHVFCSLDSIKEAPAQPHTKALIAAMVACCDAAIESLTEEIYQEKEC